MKTLISRKKNKVVDDFAEIMAEVDNSSRKVSCSMDSRAGSAALMGTQCSAGEGKGEIAKVGLAALMGTQSSARAAEHMVGSAALMGTQNPAKVAGRIGGQLGILTTVDDGCINAIGEDGWEELEFAVDSGASETVVGPHMIFSADTKDSESSRRGVCYEVANDIKIANQGEKGMHRDERRRNEPKHQSASL